MIRIINEKMVQNEGSLVAAKYIEGFCLSTDTKPVGLCTGSKMVEVDTGAEYLYDESGETWMEQNGNGGFSAPVV